MREIYSHTRIDPVAETYFRDPRSTEEGLRITTGTVGFEGGEGGGDRREGVAAGRVISRDQGESQNSWDGKIGVGQPQEKKRMKN